MKWNSQAKMKAAAPNDTEEDANDVGFLIYREVQLRKSEAAAAESKNTSSASIHQRRTSTRKRTPVQSQSRESLPSHQNSKRNKRESSVEEHRSKKKVGKK